MYVSTYNVYVFECICVSTPPLLVYIDADCDTRHQNEAGDGELEVRMYNQTVRNHRKCEVSLLFGWRLGCGQSLGSGWNKSWGYHEDLRRQSWRASISRAIKNLFNVHQKLFKILILHECWNVKLKKFALSIHLLAHFLTSRVVQISSLRHELTLRLGRASPLATKRLDLRWRSLREWRLGPSQRTGQKRSNETAFWQHQQNVRTLWSMKPDITEYRPKSTTQFDLFKILNFTKCTWTWSRCWVPDPCRLTRYQAPLVTLGSALRQSERSVDVRVALGKEKIITELSGHTE